MLKMMIVSASLLNEMISICYGKLEDKKPIIFKYTIIYFYVSISVMCGQRQKCYGSTFMRYLFMLTE